MAERRGILNNSIQYIIVIACISIVIMCILEVTLIKNIIKGMLSLSNFILYNTAAISLETGLFSLIDQVIDNNRSMQFLDYLFEFLNYKAEHHISRNNIKVVETFHEVIFDNVYFQYPGTNTFSLEAINLTIKAGDKICLVGENGSGKTTLIKLLLGIYRPTIGAIYLNGIDIKDYDSKVYNTLFSTTFQDFIHYFFDVKSNIVFGDVTKVANMEYLKSVTDRTNTTEFIESYPYGYETKLSKMFYDYGIEPSIGQWQKLAISRAIFKDAPVLLFDEPTASLDPKAEDEIFKLLDKLGEGKTILLISHRMCSAKQADKVILLDKGKILEIGSHNTLMKKK